PQTDNNYSFEVTNGAGSPARWNPCESVHYLVEPAGAPAGWQNDVSNDISQAANATGLSFVSDGTSGSAPSGYNGIVISWTSQLSGGDTVGLTTYSYYNVSSYSPQIVSANIQLLGSLRGGTGTSGEEPVLLHELGHALGLGHVNAAEVMNPVDQGYTTYHAGDLNGLTRLGASQGGCGSFYS
ncbi:MAG TPA: M66 family metalloprotease, partial [Dermatophilaceae bacterium]|nr:M66 family metalloprotease [Dermatophilaceae bacterium]